MDFTREPVVETIITPKEGYKLMIRSSHGGTREEYSVNAIEVISFGNSYFFRCLEKPKAFLLPLAEYEVVEIREVRSVLKKPSLDKSIKIGGKKSKTAEKAEPAAEEKEQEVKKKEESLLKKKEPKKPRKRREKKEKESVEKPLSVEEEVPDLVLEDQEEAPVVKRTLLPPPTSLISEQISRYKDYLKTQGVVISKEEEEENPPLEKDDSKVEELSTENSEELSFPFGEDVLPQNPAMNGENDLSFQENKIVDIHSKEETPSSEEEDK